MRALAAALLAASAALGAGETRTVSVEAGARVYERPDASSPRLGVVDEDTQLPVLRTDGPWALVRYAGFKAWLPLSPAAEESSPGLSPVEAARLDRAQCLLAGARERRLGPIPLLTDVEDAPLLDKLARVAAALPETYAARYGVAAELGEPADRVILFAREDDYAAFSSEEPTLAGLKSSGNAGRSVAAFVAGAREPDEVAALLVHELVHLLNARAFAVELPPWLEEGMAEELSYARVDGDGRLLPATLRVRRSSASGTTVTPSGRLHWVRYDAVGPEASAARLAEDLKSGRAPELSRLLSLEWAPFTSVAERHVNYCASALLVRYLLDGEGGALAPGFRAFLAAAAAGGSARPPALFAVLGRDADALERGFARWLAARVEASSGRP